MNHITRTPQDYVGYEYKTVTAAGDRLSFYLDGYENFGWQIDENAVIVPGHHQSVVLKRDRRIVNKMELTRLQRNFEACAQEIEALERSKTGVGTAWALAVGMVGTVFMAGSVFAIVAPQPQYLLSVVLAVPAFLGWGAPYFIYRSLVRRSTRRIDPLIEQKYEEAYALCERGHSLLPK